MSNKQIDVFKCCFKNKYYRHILPFIWAEQHLMTNYTLQIKKEKINTIWALEII